MTTEPETTEEKVIEALQAKVEELDARIRAGAEVNAKLKKELKRQVDRVDQLTRGLYQVEAVFPDVEEPSAEILDLFNKVHAVVQEAFRPPVETGE